MNRSKIYDAFRVFFVLCLVVIWAKEAYADDALKMKAEAESFLRSMPDGLQSRQENAVRLATGGDVAALEAVRSARNSVPDIPENVRTLDIGGKYRLYEPAERPDGPLPVLIYLHGGGWCFGSINSCAAFCAALAGLSDIAVLAVEYPLAPEHPYPAALDATAEALEFVFSHAGEYGFDKDAVSLGGDSAGGNLALASALKLASVREKDGHSDPDSLPRLKSLVLFYPVVKVWNDGSDSWRLYGSGYGLDSGIMEAFNEAYLGEADAREALVSPYEASPEHIAALPPVLMVNAECDILRDQGQAMCDRLVEAGVEVDHVVFPGTTHLFITVPGQPTAFHKAVAATAEFLTRQ